MESITLGAIATVCSVAFGFIGYQRGVKKQCEEEGLQNGELKAICQQRDIFCNIYVIISVNYTNRKEVF